MKNELNRLTGLIPDNIDAFFMTHQQRDHVAGIKHFLKTRWFAGSEVAAGLNKTAQFPKTFEPAGNNLFDAYRNYSDIHYVNSGAKYIQLASSTSGTLKIPYDATKDIEFYQVKEYQNLFARQGICFIIFPTEFRRSEIMANDNANVKKIVTKVRNL